MARCGIVVDHCGIVVWSLWIVGDHCGSFRVLVTTEFKCLARGFYLVMDGRTLRATNRMERFRVKFTRASYTDRCHLLGNTK